LAYEISSLKGSCIGVLVLRKWCYFEGFWKQILEEEIRIEDKLKAKIKWKYTPFSVTKMPNTWALILELLESIPDGEDMHASCFQMEVGLEKVRKVLCS
jgi:hypothetical protein